jgi:elongator complex protein 1
MIGQRSQKDPKEYLPFLASLQQIQPPPYQRYKIDMHLKRWHLALQNLSQAGSEHFTVCSPSMHRCIYGTIAILTPRIVGRM